MRLGGLFRRSPLWTETTFWSLDLETEGLDPTRDAILSVGMVPVRGGVIRLGEAYATLVRPPAGHASSAGAMGAHHLRPFDGRDAPGLGEVLPEIARRAREGVLLLHHAPIEVGFLRRAYPAHGMKWRRPRIVDTVRLLYRWSARQRFLGAPSREPQLNLFAAREELGLPLYPGHDALADATATAELFLALRARLGARRLRSLL